MLSRVVAPLEACPCTNLSLSLPYLKKHCWSLLKA
jgi:hypothetical protein